MPPLLGLEEFVHLFEHLFDALANGFALFGEGVELGLGGAGGLELSCKLFTEQGYFGFSGFPWPGPPFAWPDPRPTYGCYMTRARLKNAWREVEVCS